MRGLEERLVRFELNPGVEFDSALRRLRRADELDAPLRLTPNHVFSGVPYVHGGPATFAEAESRERLQFSDGDGRGVRVAVIDTGYTPGNDWVDDRTTAGPDTLEDTDAQPQNGWLDDQAGHGTFIAGVVLSRAPSAEIVVAKVLDSEGYASDVEVAEAILEHKDADVINLSLGGYCFDDQPPVAIAEALQEVVPTTAVVAAAGNDATYRPHWPAAHKRVIAVAALDGKGNRARFSNFGWWVDAAARGTDVLSTFLKFDESGNTVTIAGRTPQQFDRWARWSGTSFAAPKVAGEIAAELSRGGHSSAREAAAALLASRPSSELGAMFDF
jgi:subtilisin family serine protease